MLLITTLSCFSFSTPHQVEAFLFYFFTNATFEFNATWSFYSFWNSLAIFAFPFFSSDPFTFVRNIWCFRLYNRYSNSFPYLYLYLFLFNSYFLSKLMIRPFLFLSRTAVNLHRAQSPSCLELIPQVSHHRVYKKPLLPIRLWIHCCAQSSLKPPPPCSVVVMLLPQESFVPSRLWIHHHMPNRPPPHASSDLVYKYFSFSFFFLFWNHLSKLESSI